MLEHKAQPPSKWLARLVVVMILVTAVVFTVTLFSLPNISVEMGVLYHINHGRLTWQQLVHSYFIGFNTSSWYRPTEYYLYYYLLEPLVGWRNIMGWKAINLVFFAGHIFAAWGLFYAYFRRDFNRQTWMIVSSLFCFLMISGPLYYTGLYEGPGYDYIYSGLLFWMLQVFYRQKPLLPHESVRWWVHIYAWSMVGVYAIALTAKEQAAIAVGLLMSQLLFEKIHHLLNVCEKRAHQEQTGYRIVFGACSPKQWLWDYRFWPLMMMVLLCVGYFMGHILPTLSAFAWYQPSIDGQYLGKFFLAFFGYNNGFDYGDLGLGNDAWVVLRLMWFYLGLYIVIVRGKWWQKLRVLQILVMMLIFTAATVISKNNPWHHSIPYAMNAMLETVFFVWIFYALFSRYLASNQFASVLAISVMVVIGSVSPLVVANLTHRMQAYRGDRQYHIVSALQHPPVAFVDMPQSAAIIVNVERDPILSNSCERMCYYRYSAGKLFALVYQDLSIWERYVVDDRKISSLDLIQWLLAEHPYYFIMRHAPILDQWWQVKTPLWQDGSVEFKPKAIALLAQRLRAGTDTAVLTQAHASWPQILLTLSEKYPDQQQVFATLKTVAVQFANEKARLQREHALWQFWRYPERPWS